MNERDQCVIILVAVVVAGAGYNQQHVRMDQGFNVFSNAPPVNAQSYPYPPHTIDRRGI